MAHLTDEERRTLNMAADIIMAHTPRNASWMFGINHWHGSRSLSSSAYFTSEGAQHSFLGGDTLADHVENALAIQAAEDADAEGIKELKIANLRKQLASLTGEAA